MQPHFQVFFVFIISSVIALISKMCCSLLPTDPVPLLCLLLLALPPTTPTIIFTSQTPHVHAQLSTMLSNLPSPIEMWNQSLGFKEAAKLVEKFKIGDVNVLVVDESKAGSSYVCKLIEHFGSEIVVRG